MEATFSEPLKGNYTLKNVRLETAFIFDGEDIAGTQTELFCIVINEGKIAKIFPNDAELTNAIKKRLSIKKTALRLNWWLSLSTDCIIPIQLL